MRSAPAAIAASCVTMTIESFLSGFKVRRIAGFLRRWPVQVAGGLVGEQDLGARDERPGDGGALHFAAGQFAGLVLEPVREAHHFQQLFGAVERPGALRS